MLLHFSNSLQNLPNSWATFERTFVTKNFENRQIWSHCDLYRINVLSSREMIAKFHATYEVIWKEVERNFFQ